MTPIHSFSLAKHDGPYESWPLKTRLLLDQQSTHVEIAGYVIEGQYRCPNGFLLITSYDCPFEEISELILLTSDLCIAAHETLGAPYESYLLNAHWAIDDRALRLHYNDRLFYTLTIRESKLRSPALVLERDEAPERDPRSAASIDNLSQRLAAIDAAQKR